MLSHTVGQGMGQSPARRVFVPLRVMPPAAESIAKPPIDIDGLTTWIERTVPAVVTPVKVDLVALGRSNLTYRIDDACGSRFMLRRPPVVVLSPSAHDVAREWSIMSAVAATDLPMPPLVALCEDASVIGAPFFMTKFVPGLSLSNPEAVDALSATARVRIGHALAHALATLHRLDVDQVGLGHLVRTHGYIERQLRHWSRRLEGHDLPSDTLFAQVQAALSRRVPAPQGLSLLHGDFKLENMIISKEGDISAILDWELAAVGDPLADLGWLLAWWTEPEELASWISPPPSVAGGFPKREVLASLYAAASGLDLFDLEYYVAFAYWRLSCINLDTGSRFRAGAMSGKHIDLNALDRQVSFQLQAAWDLLRGGT